MYCTGERPGGLSHRSRLKGGRTLGSPGRGQRWGWRCTPSPLSCDSCQRFLNPHPRTPPPPPIRENGGNSTGFQRAERWLRGELAHPPPQTRPMAPLRYRQRLFLIIWASLCVCICGGSMERAETLDFSVAKIY
jgi:hypothetical protein